jgi:hypothetical protein
MAAETERRRRLKNSKRGRVAQPDLIFQRGEWIPGVPAFHEGGIVHNLIEHAADNPPFDFGRTDEEGLRAGGWFPVTGRPGVWVHPQLGQMDLNAPTPSGPTGPTPQQMELQREQLRIQQEQNDIQRRGQDLLQERARLDRELEQAIAAQDIELRRQIETRIAANEQTRLQLERDAHTLALLQTQIDARLRQQELLTQQRGQDVTQRGQDIGAQIAMHQARLQDLASQRQDAVARGDLELARAIEMRMRAEMQQAATLQQHQQALGAAGLGIEAQTGAAGTMAQLAGPMAELQANPRNFMELQFQLGGGQNFLNQLMAGQPIGSQSAANITGSPAPGFRGAGDVQSIFQQAMAAAQQLSQMGQNVPGAPNLQALLGLGQLPPMAPMPAPIPTPPMGAPMPPPVAPVPAMAGGGQMVTNEPIVGMGMLSGRPRFTVGEPTAQFPQGAPELLKVMPMQEGGIIGAGTFWDKPGMAPTLPAPEALRPALPQPKAAAQAGQPPVQVVINTPQAATAPSQPSAPTAPVPMGTAPTAPPMPGPKFQAEVDFINDILSRWPNITEVDAFFAQEQNFTKVSNLLLRLSAGIITPQQAWQLLKSWTVGVPAGPGPPAPPTGPTKPTGPAPPAPPPEFTGSWPTDVPKFDPVTGNPINIDPVTGQPVIIDPDTGKVLGPWARPTPPPEAPGPGPEEFIRALMAAMNPKAYYNMLPSQGPFLSSLISAMGIPPGDLWESIFRQWPTGPDPSRTMFGNFSEGGTILTWPSSPSAA